MNPGLAQRVAERFASLPIEKRRLLYAQVCSQGMALSQLPIVPLSAGAARPLSAAQLRQWFLWQLDKDSTAYHISAALKLRGQVDKEALRSAFAALVFRHESLRTVFQSSGADVVEQAILPSENFALLELDADEAERIANTPFDLTTGPLFRVGLIRLSLEEHVLVAVMHHIVSDGWSMQIIVNEFVELYRAQVEGREADLKPLPIQYADYAVWQRNWLEAGEQERQLDYWKVQLGAEHPVLQLPTDHPRPAEPKYRAAHCSLELPASLTEGLHRRAREHRATLFMVLLAGFQVLLYRYTGQQDVRVGATNANRNRPETQRVVGLFVNTQVLRARVDSQLTLSALLDQVREAVVGAQEHQELPFEQLVEALQPERSLHHPPLFQVLMNHQRQEHRQLGQLPGLALQPYALGEQAAKFELRLSTTERADGGVGGALTYAAELFEPQTIALLGEHYLKVLTALAEKPQQRIGEMDLLSQVEEEQLRRWGIKDQRDLSMQSVHGLFDDQVKRACDAVALTGNEEELSYRELSRRATQLTRRLILFGVEREVRVGVHAGRSIEFVVGLLAVWKAGGVYVPLDPHLPEERLAYQLKDSGARVLLSTSPVMWAGDVPVLELELDEPLVEDVEALPLPQIHPAQPAYVIYTSGSTGQPKGVVISHGALSNYVQGVLEALKLPEDVRNFAMVSTVAADLGHTVLFGSLCSGRTLHLISPEHAFDPDRFAAYMREHQIAVLKIAPSHLQGLLSAENTENVLPWHTLIVGGEATSWALLEYIRELKPSCRVINHYGPTETTVGVFTHDAAQERPDIADTLPIGTPLPNTQGYVLDAYLNPTPRGVQGELFIGGSGLAHGYQSRGGLTAERFVADPSSVAGERLYRTGDEVRWNRDGQLEYLGRIDHQVKIRGFRIELGEIEAQLLAQPEVREAGVIVREGPGGPRLMAYVVGRARTIEIDVANLRARLTAVLPDYMVPAHFTVLEKLPLNVSGKLDRKALPEPEYLHAAGYEAPQGEMEQAVAAVWSEVLGVDAVGRNDDFFGLGGHSLLALRVIGRMREKGMTTSVRTLFRHPQFAAFVRASAQDRDRREVVVPPNLIPAGCQAIHPEMLTLIELDAEQIQRIEAAVPGGAANIQDIYPLVALQEGILFHHTLQSEGDVYLALNLLGFDSRERLESFMAILNRVIERHDILRTAVLWEGLKEPVQVVYRHCEVQLEWLSSDVEGSALERLSDSVDLRRDRMDIRKAPMLRAVAVRDTEHQRWLLQLISHHVILDHETLERLVEEIALIQQGRESELPEPIPFRRFVAQSCLGISRSEHEAFFKRMLSDVDEPTAPFGLLGVQDDAKDVEEARLRLDDALAKRIRQQAQIHSVSAAALFHLAWALVLSNTTGKDDVVFGTVLFGRMQGVKGADRALGMFINTLPVRIKSAGRSAGQCLKEIHEVLTQLMHHEHARLSLAQRCSGLPAGTPLFSALLNYRYSVRHESDGPGKEWEGIQNLKSETRNNYPVTMSVDDLGQGFELVSYATRLVGASRLCEYLHKTIVELVVALARRTDEFSCDLHMLGRAEREQLLRWASGDHRYMPARSVNQLVSMPMRRSPEKLALIVGEQELSYGELNRRATCLARRLIESGVDTEVRVGLHAERSIEFVVGLLAVWKAGGVYVPLDPRLPSERLVYQLQDCRARVLLSATPVDWSSEVPVIDLMFAESMESQDGDASEQPLPEVHPSQAAYVIYTSGSTGRPKGVAVCHGALASYVQGVLETLALPDNVHDFAMVSTVAADLGHTVLFGALCSGRTVHLISHECAFDPDRFAAYLREHRIDVMKIVPSHLQALLSAATPKDVLPWHTLIVGGEATSWPLLERIRELAPECRVINHYGPTETTVGVLTHDAQQERLAIAETLPIGTPLPNTQGYVLDPYLNPTPQGVRGELYIGGSGLAQGYQGRSDLTAERFVASPFKEGERLYRTGDRVRVLKDGSVEFLGRTDDQVKVRGYRVELKEVASMLKAQPGVREAEVIARTSKDGRVQLHGYVVAETGTTLDLQVLQAQLSTLLPEYMVPSAIIVLESLPLTANGKIDRKALPEPGWVEDRYEAPQGELEQALASIWAELLGVGRVGRHDNFFELGGDSILALKVIARARQRSIVLAPKQLFVHQTLNALAKDLAGKSGAKFQTKVQRMAEIDRLLEEFVGSQKC